MAYAPLSHIVQPSHNKRIALEALLASDEALEARCLEAWGLVSSCETLRQSQQVVGLGGQCSVSGTGSSTAPGPELATKEQRQLVLDFGLQLVQRLGWKPDVCYDAFDLLQRVLPLVRASAQQEAGAGGDTAACSSGRDTGLGGSEGEVSDGNGGSGSRDDGGGGSGSGGVQALSVLVVQQLMLGCIMVAARQGEMVGRLLPFELLSRQTGETPKPIRNP